MLASGRDLVYWDADVWLSYVNAVLERFPILDSLLADSSRPTGGIRLVTSEVSIVEVAFAASERANRALDASVEAALDALWDDSEAVALAEYHRLIGNEARNLIRLGLTKGRRLKPNDAIHLATARRLGVAEFHTYEKRLQTYSPESGFPIQGPTIPQPRLMP